MFELIALFGVVIVSMTIIRFGATALRMTGLSTDVARFQAKSAFSGVGYTTSESELVISHPLRRRIVSLMVTVGNFGVPAMMAAILLAFQGAEDAFMGAQRIAAVLCILICLAIIARSQWIDGIIEHIIEWLLARWTEIEVVDYQSVLEVERGYRVARLPIKADSWLAQGSSLRDLRLAQAGVLVIGIHRGGDYIGTPGADVVILPGDELMVYAAQSTIEELSTRTTGYEGDVRHLEAMRRHDEVRKRESAMLHQASMRAAVSLDSEPDTESDAHSWWSERVASSGKKRKKKQARRAHSRAA